MALVIAHSVRPCPGYEVSGDGVMARVREHDTLLAISDGVGHGERAAAATAAILGYLQDTVSTNLTSILRECDRRAAGTRGAALALVLMEHGSTSLAHIGIGNVNASLWTPDRRSQTMLNHNGMVGRLSKIPEPIEYLTEDHQLLLLHSDGISSRHAYAEMSSWDGQLDAQVGRLMALAVDRDDASVLLAQIRHDRPA